MFLKLGWPKVLTFHFYVTRKHKMSRDFFFSSILQKKKKIKFTLTRIYVYHHVK